MSKGFLGVLALGLAILNIYWAAKIYSLHRAAGSLEEKRVHADRAERLQQRSKVSAVLFLLVYLGYLWFSRS